MSTNKEHKKAIERLYVRYEYLAEVYTQKIYNYDRLGMERDDIIQEFKLKIWYSITKYVERWANYKRTGKYKPIPLPFFLKNNLNKLIIDFSKKINSYYVDVLGNQHQRINGVVSMQEVGFDMGKNTEVMSNLDLSGKGKLIIGGIDILSGLDKRECRVFCMYLKGYPMKTINKVVPELDASEVIHRQINNLKPVRQELLSRDEFLYKSFNHVEDDQN
jgi:hypothetical protein